MEPQWHAVWQGNVGQLVEVRGIEDEKERVWLGGLRRGGVQH